MSHIDLAVLKSKFRGALVGSLLGDCLGAPFEGELVSSGDKIVIQKYFDKLESPDLKGPIRSYTDDTAMMKSVAKTFIDKPEVDYTYMAKLFVKEYFAEPKRGYGESIVEVFSKLRKRKFEDVYKPAQEQFNGSGSFGNGGGMRVAPVALYFYNNYDAMIDVAKKSTQLTHTHSLGVHGAVFQCIAVSQALACNPKKKIDPEQFCNELKQKMKEVEKENDDGLNLKVEQPYVDKINVIQHFLKAKYNDELDEEIGIVLGNNICAIESVPTALYCFLRSLEEIPTVKTDNIFRRTIQYAITLGGDTDTIACMAGGIAGAYLGEEAINRNMAKQCESYEKTIEMADSLYNAVCGASNRAQFLLSDSATFITIGLSDTALMDMVVSNLQQQRATTEQLRREAAIKRMPVSLAVADIIKYITEHEQDDCLLVGFTSQRVNPFREKTPCTLL
ncbi:ADP ribosyl GH and/or G-gamma domain containing protein [Asbolus verrucosus]|uniref:ADP-ribosylhydrolase ARH3 n=1 Tax=Asbolus verrucosus TaxID=1661398 RepID=A0A482VX27_ASBVE|nr:ADP ribosyl GH and/or G-gamma domain containing protein [Asbolus verrucosus]